MSIRDSGGQDVTQLGSDKEIKRLFDNQGECEKHMKGEREEDVAVSLLVPLVCFILRCFLLAL